MTMRRGVDADIKLNGILYRCQEWSVDETNPLDDVSNTKGEGAGPGALTAKGSSARLVDVPNAKVTITQATFDDADNPFAAPYELSISEYVELQIFPAGVAAGNPWNFPSLAISDISHSGKVPGPQPVSFTGESDGGYTEPA